MFNKFWNRTSNSKGLYTQEQINNIKEEINKIDRKIQSMKEVIDAYLTSGGENQKRILINQKEIEKKEQEKSLLLTKLNEMEAKSVD